MMTLTRWGVYGCLRLALWSSILGSYMIPVFNISIFCNSADLFILQIYKKLAIYNLKNQN